MRRTLGLILFTLACMPLAAAAEDGEKLRDYLEGTCAMAGAGKGAPDHDDCMAEERESFEDNLASMRERFEAACEDASGDDRAACMREQGERKADEFRGHIDAVEDDTRARGAEELHERLSQLCTQVLRQSPGSASHDYCIAQHAIQYSYFAEAAVEALEQNPDLSGY
ncbi:hypothetical protein [Aquisalimonas sp.]|uniref:hypothetical protein n=1 Tax=unclassified Aquisalimonas TaxID=2644645 RepID=UPI0025C5EB91|nr:hypothetical protein [Aquisalimonas sp.]